MPTHHHFFAVILAGGSGTRFWPESRRHRPKQFLSIIGSKSLYEQTLERMAAKIPAANIIVVTNIRYKTLVQKESRPFGIPAQNILYETSGKNTAPAIGWATARIYRKDRDAITAVLPSDHWIARPKVFWEKIDEAVKLAATDRLVTLGIVPSRPETGFGYLKIERCKQKGRGIFRRVVQFIEKPPLAKARQYVKRKDYFWNSGMFVWKAAVIREELKNYLPEVFSLFLKNDSQGWANRIWNQLPSISIDYGVLEKSLHVACVPAGEIGWSDVGSWEALHHLLPKDKNRNVFSPRNVVIDCQGTLIKGNGRLIAAVGLSGVAIVDTDDALLVCKIDQSQKLRDVMTALKGKKRKEI